MESLKITEVINLRDFNRESLLCRCKSLIGHYKKNNHGHYKLDCSGYKCKNKSVMGSAILIRGINLFKIFIIPSCRSCANNTKWYKINKSIKLKEAYVCGSDNYPIHFYNIISIYNLLYKSEFQTKKEVADPKHPEKFEVFRHNKENGIIAGIFDDHWIVAKHQDFYLMNDNKELFYMSGIPISADGDYMLFKDNNIYYLYDSNGLYKTFRLSDGNYKVINTKIGIIIYDLDLPEIILINNDDQIGIKSHSEFLLISYKGIYCKNGKFIKWNGKVSSHHCPVTSIKDIYMQYQKLILFIKNFIDFKLYVYSTENDAILWMINLTTMDYHCIKPYIVANGSVLDLFTGEKIFSVENESIVCLKKSKNGYLAAIK